MVNGKRTQMKSTTANLASTLEQSPHEIQANEPKSDALLRSTSLRLQSALLAKQISEIENQINSLGKILIQLEPRFIPSTLHQMDQLTEQLIDLLEQQETVNQALLQSLNERIGEDTDVLSRASQFLRKGITFVRGKLNEIAQEIEAYAKAINTPSKRQRAQTSSTPEARPASDLQAETHATPKSPSQDKPSPSSGPTQGDTRSLK